MRNLKILAAAVTLAAASMPAHADKTFNGVPLNTTGFNGLLQNGGGSNGISLQGISLQGISLQGTSLGGVKAGDAIAVTLPDGTLVKLR